MEDIEYLEEYEDLILPTIKSNSSGQVSFPARSGCNKSNNNNNMMQDEDSSSIDQDIFESLFDDHSDDESNILQKKVDPKLSQRRLDDRASLDSLDMLVKDLVGEQSKTPTQTNVASTSSSKIYTQLSKKLTSTPNTQTTAGRGLQKASPLLKARPAPPTKTLNTGQLSKAPTGGRPSIHHQFPKRTTEAAAIANRPKSKPIYTKNPNRPDTSKSDNKSKSVATARPTAQQQKRFPASNANRSLSSSASPRPSSSLATNLAARKQVTLALQKNKILPLQSCAKRPVQRPPTTIVKPEKRESKDPAEDPLSLDDIAEALLDSDSFSLSDISDDTFASLSDFDDDPQNTIDISNDSSIDDKLDHKDLENVRVTPSPTVSEDREDITLSPSPTQMKTKDNITKQSTGLLSDATTSTKSIRKVPEKVTIISDTLLSRIDTAFLANAVVDAPLNKIVETDAQAPSSDKITSAAEICSNENLSLIDSTTKENVEAVSDASILDEFHDAVDLIEESIIEREEVNSMNADEFVVDNDDKNESNIFLQDHVDDETMNDQQKENIEVAMEVEIETNVDTENPTEFQESIDDTIFDNTVAEEEHIEECEDMTELIEECAEEASDVATEEIKITENTEIQAETKNFENSEGQMKLKRLERKRGADLVTSTSLLESTDANTKAFKEPLNPQNNIKSKETTTTIGLTLSKHSSTTPLIEKSEETSPNVPAKKAKLEGRTRTRFRNLGDPDIATDTSESDFEIHSAPRRRRKAKATGIPEAVGYNDASKDNVKSTQGSHKESGTETETETETGETQKAVVSGNSNKSKQEESLTSSLNNTQSNKSTTTGDKAVKEIVEETKQNNDHQKEGVISNVVSPQKEIQFNTPTSRKSSRSRSSQASDSNDTEDEKHLTNVKGSPLNVKAIRDNTKQKSASRKNKLDRYISRADKLLNSENEKKTKVTKVVRSVETTKVVKSITEPTHQIESSAKDMHSISIETKDEENKTPTKMCVSLKRVEEKNISEIIEEEKQESAVSSKISEDNSSIANKTILQKETPKSVVKEIQPNEERKENNETLQIKESTKKVEEYDAKTTNESEFKSTEKLEKESNENEAVQKEVLNKAKISLKFKGTEETLQPKDIGYDSHSESVGNKTAHATKDSLTSGDADGFDSKVDNRNSKVDESSEDTIQSTSKEKKSDKDVSIDDNKNSEGSNVTAQQNVPSKRSVGRPVGARERTYEGQKNLHVTRSALKNKDTKMIVTNDRKKDINDDKKTYKKANISGQEIENTTKNVVKTEESNIPGRNIEQTTESSQNKDASKVDGKKSDENKIGRNINNQESKHATRSANKTKADDKPISNDERKGGLKTKELRNKISGENTQFSNKQALTTPLSPDKAVSTTKLNTKTRPKNIEDEQEKKDISRNSKTINLSPLPGRKSVRSNVTEKDAKSVEAIEEKHNIALTNKTPDKTQQKRKSEVEDSTNAGHNHSKRRTIKSKAEVEDKPTVPHPSNTTTKSLTSEDDKLRETTVADTKPQQKEVSSNDDEKSLDISGNNKAIKSDIKSPTRTNFIVRRNYKNQAISQRPEQFASAILTKSGMSFKEWQEAQKLKKEPFDTPPKPDSSQHNKDVNSPSKDIIKSDKKVEKVIDRKTAEESPQASSSVNVAKDGSIEKADKPTARRINISKPQMTDLPKETSNKTQDISIDKTHKSTSLSKETFGKKSEESISNIHSASKEVSNTRSDKSNKIMQRTVPSSASTSSKIFTSNVSTEETLSAKKETVGDKKENVIDKKESLSDKKDTLSDKKETISDKKKTLSNKKETLSGKKDILSDKKELLSEKKELLSEKKETLSEKKKTSSEKNDILSDKKELLSEKKEFLSEKKELLSEKKELLSEKQETLSGKKDTLSGKKETSSEKKETLSEKKEISSDKKEILNEMEETLSDKKETFIDKKDTPSRKKEILSEKKETLDSKNDSLGVEKDTLSEKKDILSEEKETISDKKEILSEKKEILSERKETLSDKKETLSDKKETSSRKKEILSEKKETSSGNRKILSEKTEALSDKKETLSDTKETSSVKKRILSDNKGTLTDKKKSLGDKIESISDKKETMSDKIDISSNEKESLSDKKVTPGDKTESLSDKMESISDKKETLTDKRETSKDNMESLADESERLSDKMETTNSKSLDEENILIDKETESCLSEKEKLNTRPVVVRINKSINKNANKKSPKKIETLKIIEVRDETKVKTSNEDIANTLEIPTTSSKVENDDKNSQIIGSSQIFVESTIPNEVQNNSRDSSVLTVVDQSSHNKSGNTFESDCTHEAKHITELVSKNEKLSEDSAQKDKTSPASETLNKLKQQIEKDTMTTYVKEKQDSSKVCKLLTSTETNLSSEPKGSLIISQEPKLKQIETHESTNSTKVDILESKKVSSKSSAKTEQSPQGKCDEIEKPDITEKITNVLESKQKSCVEIVTKSSEEKRSTPTNESSNAIDTQHNSDEIAAKVNETATDGNVNVKTASLDVTDNVNESAKEITSPSPKRKVAKRIKSEIEVLMESLPKGLELPTVDSKRRRRELPLGRKHSILLGDTKSSPTFKTPPGPVKALSIITTPKKNPFASDTVVPRYTRSVVSADKSIKLVSWKSRIIQGNNRARISRRPSEKSRNRGNSGKSRPPKSTEATVEKTDEFSNKTHNVVPDNITTEVHDIKSKVILETSSTTSTAEKTKGVSKKPSQNISEKSTTEISEEFSKPTTEETSSDKRDMIVDSAERVCIEHELHITVPEHKYKYKKLRVRVNRSIVRKYVLNLRKPKTTAIFPTPMSKTSSEITRTGTKSRTPTEQANSLASMLLRALNSPSIPPPPPSPSRKPITSTTSAGTSFNMQELHSNIATRSKALSLSLASTIQQQQAPALGFSIPDNTNHEEAMATTTSGSHCDESFLLTPLKTTSPALSVRQQTQQQQQQPQQQKRSARLQQLTQKQIAKELIPTISSTTTTQTTKEQLTSTSTTTLSQQQTYFLPVEPKKEFDDEQTSAAVAGQSLSALMIGGVPAEIVDNSGTRLYSFLHPAKYNRGHGAVLLDYCCPNLDGPMSAIDPTREHSQVQTLVRELPAYIVMSTKVITRADLEAKNNSIPESIRKKMGKLNSASIAANSVRQAAISTATATQTSTVTVAQPLIASSAGTLPVYTPSITALQKQLPPTTTLTPKMPLLPMPVSTTSSDSLPLLTPFSAMISSNPVGSETVASTPPTLYQKPDYQRYNNLRTNLRRFDTVIKKHSPRICVLAYSDRKRIIESILNHTQLTAKDVENATLLLEEYCRLINNTIPPKAITYVATPTINTATHTTTATASFSDSNFPSPATATVQSSSLPTSSITTNAAQRLEQIHASAVQKVKTAGSGMVMQRQVPIYDKDRNIIGYQMQVAPTATSSTMSARASIMSSKQISTPTSSTAVKRPSTAVGTPAITLKQPQQESPRIFYTKPLQTSTPISSTTTTTSPTVLEAAAARLGRSMTIRHIAGKNLAAPRLPALPQKTTINVSGGNISKLLPKVTSANVTTTAPHLSTSTSFNTPSTVTTTQRVTRHAAASKSEQILIITKDSDGSIQTTGNPDECILPDDERDAAELKEIKRELDDDLLTGGR